MSKTSKMMNVRFSENQQLKISEISEITGQNASVVSRAAMHLGMLQIIALAAMEPEKAGELVVINDFRSK